MKKLMLVSTAAALMCAFLVRPLWSDDEGSGDGKGGGNGADADAMKPGPEHKDLAKLVGKWDVAGKFWMKPGEPSTDSGTSEFKSILEGRYFQQEFSGTFLKSPYSGMGVMGYDRFAKHYTMYWCDSISTMPMFVFGTSKDGGKTIEYTGEMPDGKGGTAKYRMVLAWKSDDSWTYEMYDVVDGKDVKGMELTYTRKK